MRQKKFWFTISEILAVLAVALMLSTNATAASKYKVLHRFKGRADGRAPYAGLVFDSAGNLYGTTAEGGNSTKCLHGCGTVFELTPNSDGTWTEHVLHSFDIDDGEYPFGKLIFDAAGNLYGTTSEGGGASGSGTVFELTPNSDGSWTEHVLHSFDIDDGASPDGKLIFDAAGNLYGTTVGGGGANGSGTVFELTPNSGGTWTEHVLYIFTGGTDGGYPEAGLLFDAAGNLYGTTLFGGLGACFLPQGCGVLFELTPHSDGTWTEHVLHSFTGRKDGGVPTGDLIFDAMGNLYGATINGGDIKSCRRQGVRGCGVIFELIPHSDGSWTERVLHTFENRPASNPYAGLIFDAVGNLYGIAHRGGPVDGGVVFKLIPESGGSWAFNVLHVFLGKPALLPDDSLILDNAGNLYSTASYCASGEGCNGVVFEITP
jgi:uncharacterized repeat protein (TIGR03803 family)